MKPVLVLNADYSPFDVWSWQRAMRKLHGDSPTIFSIKYYDWKIRDGKGNLYDVPAVVCLKDFIPIHNKSASYGKANIYARDMNKCGYCNEEVHGKHRTIDHVIPKAHWNPRRFHFKLHSFENVITCCVACNRKKRFSFRKTN